MSSISKRVRNVVTPTLGWDSDLVALRSDGLRVKCDDGKTYLDFASGVAVLNIGHRPKRVVAAVHKQVDTFIHSGCVFMYESIADLGERMARICPGDIDMFFFSNSGAEAVEGSIKLAKYVTNRQGIIAFRGAFHGRTLGCVSLTSSNAKYRKHYHPLLPSIYRVPFPYAYRCPLGHSPDECADESLAALDTVFRHEIYPEEVAAIIIEPVQGEGGYVPAPKRLLQGLRKRCDEHGIMLIFDEVQSGFGRTCKWFASEHSGVVPDVMAVAKGIASGFPLSAVCAPKKIMKQWTTSAHGTTFGGNPVSCAAAAATIETIEKDRLLEKSAALSVHVFKRLRDMQRKYPAIGDVRGLGFMIGIELVGDRKAPDADLTKRTLAGCKKRGLVLIPCGINGNTIRFIPPLICTPKEMDYALDILDASLKAAGAAR